MPEVYLVRHAHAGDPEKWTGPDDARPLSEKGRLQAERLGAFLASIGFEPGLIVSSPKDRARQTADLVAGPVGGRVQLDDRLASGFDRAALEELLVDLRRPAKIVLCGHDPDFSELLADLVGAQALPMRKGALARVDLDDRLPPIEPGQGVLRWLVPPDALPGARAVEAARSR